MSPECWSWHSKGGGSHEERDLLISGGLNGSRDYSYHSGDSGSYENWVVKKCLKFEKVRKN